jgi:hypothetical protein
MPGIATVTSTEKGWSIDLSQETPVGELVAIMTRWTLLFVGITDQGMLRMRPLRKGTLAPSAIEIMQLLSSDAHSDIRSWDERPHN